ncbi:molybdate ABC transporter substrate-binding protein [uncultured Roseobacter sp.]|uniref:molybdate ABC transporter substrate-binding protein n=1 Tax=uncultured Roseobacter sp. TaxID=114847 RepID=UPI00344FC929
MSFEFGFTTVRDHRLRLRQQKTDGASVVPGWADVLRGISLAMIVGFGGVAATTASAGDVTVFAAASLKTALDEVAQGFERETGHEVAMSYAGTPVLARQISLGAPADVFISASADWMDWLQEAQAIDNDSRFDLLGNQLVLIAHGNTSPPVDLQATALMPRLQQDRIAMALVEAVPAGIYGKAALEHLGVWEVLSAQIAQTDNARAALALVATGEAPFGIVYATDAKAEPRVSVIASFPAASHPDIRYPVAAVAGRGSAPADQFIEHLRSEAAISAFETQGFVVLEPPA